MRRLLFEQMSEELFGHDTGIKMVHVPFTGNGPATMATVSGATQVIFCSTVAALPFVLNGGLKPLAFADDSRSKQLPDVPTFKEAGLDFKMGTWFGLLAPAKTPATVVEALNRSLKKSLETPEFNRIAESQGAQVLVSSPEEFAAFLRAASQRLTKVIGDANIGVR